MEHEHAHQIAPPPPPPPRIYFVAPYNKNAALSALYMQPTRQCEANALELELCILCHPMDATKRNLTYMR